MKKITTLVALLMATAMTFGLMATTNGAGRVIYLNTGGSSLWDQGGAKFAIWFFNPGPGTFTDFMTPVEGETGIYKATIDFNDTKFFLCALTALQQHQHGTMLLLMFGTKLVT